MSIQLYAKMLIPAHVRRNQQRRCKKRLWYPNRDCLQILEPGRKFAKEPTSKEEPDAKVLKRSYISSDKSLREDDTASNTHSDDTISDSDDTSKALDDSLYMELHSPDRLRSTINSASTETRGDSPSIFRAEENSRLLNDSIDNLSKSVPPEKMRPLDDATGSVHTL